MVTPHGAKAVYREMAARPTPESPAEMAARLGLLMVDDPTELWAWVDGVIAACPREAARYRAGETKLLDFLVGRLLKQHGPRAFPDLLALMLAQRLDTIG